MSKHGSCVGHAPCPRCGSKDNVALYSDGYATCYTPGCGYYVLASGKATPMSSKKKAANFLEGEYGPLPARAITEETCRKFRYQKAIRGGEPVQVATYCDAKGEPQAQKIRTKDKEFAWIGDAKDSLLFGQWCWGDGGKRLVITEGEIDAMSVSQAFNNKWPVVSVPNGAGGAKRSIEKHLEWIEKYDEVVLCFDSDKPGREAAIECAEVLTPGKAKIATLPLKDANEMLLAGKATELTAAIMFNARPYRPDGIVTGDSTLDLVLKFSPKADAQYPWPCFNPHSHGIRRGELVVHTAGTGIGKSTICRELFYDLGTRQNQKVGIIALEESVSRLALHLTGLAANHPIHLSDGGFTQEQKAEYWKKSIGNGNFVLYDHWGSIDGSNLLNRIRYMIRGCGCNWILLDHISIVTSGDDQTNDERRSVDLLMTKLRSLVEETGAGVHIVSHLSRRSDGKSHEEGAQVSLRDLRSSHSIAQLADLVWAYERNQQSKSKANLITARLLKNRYSGVTGIAGALTYVSDTGRVVEADVAALSQEEEDSDF